MHIHKTGIEGSLQLAQEGRFSGAWSGAQCDNLGDAQDSKNASDGRPLRWGEFDRWHGSVPPDDAGMVVSARATPGGVVLPPDHSEPND
jgi:hypothetical protein